MTQAFADKIDGIGGGSRSFGVSAARVSVAAVIGGTASEISGGKFANGAVTGAFSRAFNDQLHFNGEKLRHYDDDGNLMGEYSAVSGRRGSRIVRFGGDALVVEYDYTGPEQQDRANLGPIPEGEYIVRQDELQSISSITLTERALGTFGRGPWPGLERSWGNYRIWLTPAAGTDTLGRSGFSIHGGTEFGSAGCIDLCSGIDAFVKAFRAAGEDIPLFVKYD